MWVRVYTVCVCQGVSRCVVSCTAHCVTLGNLRNFHFRGVGTLKREHRFSLSRKLSTRCFCPRCHHIWLSRCLGSPRSPDHREYTELRGQSGACVHILYTLTRLYNLFRLHYKPNYAVLFFIVLILHVCVLNKWCIHGYCAALQHSVEWIILFI